VPDQYSGRRRYSTFSPKPRKPLKPMSDKRARQLDEYEDACDAALERDSRQCRLAASVRDVKCWGPIDPHHIVPVARSPRLRCDVDNIIAVCRGHHDWIDANMDEATALGWLALPPPVHQVRD
jgi:hypothetical protein